MATRTQEFAATLTVVVGDLEEKFSNDGTTTGDVFRAVADAVATSNGQCWDWAFGKRGTRGGFFTLTLDVVAGEATHRFETKGDSDDTYRALGQQAYGLADTAQEWAHEQRRSGSLPESAPSKGFLAGVFGR